MRGADSYNNDYNDNSNDDDNNDGTTIAMVRNNNNNDAPGPRPRKADSIPAPVSSPSMAPQHAACNLEDDKHDERGKEEDDGGGGRHCWNGWQSITRTTLRLRHRTLSS